MKKRMFRILFPILGIVLLLNIKPILQYVNHAIMQAVSAKMDAEEEDRARRGISYGFQQPPRFKGIRVSDLLNVAAGKNLGHDEACSYLTKVGLCARDYLSRDVDTSLSGGEVKRIEIATILAKNASLMLFDEPEAGIDLWSFARLTETFQRLHDEGGRTIIIISHQERIIRLADEILLISGGQVTGRGTADDIYPQILADTVTGCNMLEVDGTC